MPHRVPADVTPLTRVEIHEYDARDWIPTTTLIEETQRLAAHLPKAIDAVVGVSRSGLIPATLIATLIHRPLYSIHSSAKHPAQVQDLSGGWRMTGLRLPEPRAILLIDDTAAHGFAMQAAHPVLSARWPRARIIRAAIFAQARATEHLDLWAATLPPPHYLEWNLWNSGHCDPTMNGGLATDMDGILCPDFLPAEDDDGPIYRDAMANRPALARPNRCQITAIITARCEKYRPITERWLALAGIQYQRLIMGPWNTKAERETAGADQLAAWKAAQYLDSRACLMVESDPYLAHRIAEISRMPVLCPALERVLNPHATPNA